MKKIFESFLNVLSIRLKLVMVVILSCAIGNIAILSLWKPQNLNSLITNEIVNQQQHLMMLSDSLTPFLLSQQYGSVFETLKITSSRQKNWVYITLLDENEKQIYPLEPLPDIQTNDFFKLEQVIKVDHLKIGKLKLVFNTQTLLESHRAQTYIIFSIINLGFFLASILLWSIIEWQVISRINRISRIADRNGKNSSNIPIPDKGLDEIGSLAKSLSLMTSKIYNSNLEFKKLHSAIEQSADMVIITNKYGIIEYVNSALCQKMGYSKDELIGQPPSIFKSSKTEYTVYQSMWKSLNEKKTWQGRLINLTKAGNEIPISMSATPALDAKGKIFSYVSIQKDITNEVALENKLNSIAEKEKEANRAKSLFLANMSHEIRTPMNAVLGVGQLLKETQLTTEQENALEIFEKAGKNLLQIINDILDLSKIEAGQIVLEKVSFDLLKTAQDAVDIFSVEAAKKDLALTLNCSSSIKNCFYSGDPTRIKQILSNLISNAIKFTKTGGVEITIDTNSTSKKGNFLFSVRDTGIGIQKNRQHLIFDRFSQADSSINRNYGGTGLGLAISKNFVELMSGEIWFESTQNVGTTFYFTLSLEESSQLGLKNTINLNHVDLSTLNKLHLLIVDDSEDNIFLIRNFLKQTPWTIDAAMDGKTAVNMATTGNIKYDLILMDMEMPIMNGVEATELIRTIEKDTAVREIPIVAFTAHAIEEFKSQMIRAGCNDCITKPIKKDTLIKIIIQHTTASHLLKSVS